MRRCANRGAVILSAFLLLTLAGTRVLSAQSSQPKPHSPQGEKRRKLLKEMGLEKNDQPPPATPPPSNDADASAVTPAAPHGTDEVAPRVPRGKKPPSSSLSFQRVIHPLLVQTCKSCHAAGGAAAATHLLLSGEAGPDHAAVMSVLDVRAPAASELLVKASGQKVHGGGAAWPAGGGSYDRVLAWIQAGARLDGPGPSASGGTATPLPLPLPSPVRVVPRVATPAAPEAGAAPAVPDGGSEIAAPTDIPVVGEVVAAPEIKTIDFAGRVHPLLMRTCATCHSLGGAAAPTRLVLSGDVHDDYAKIRPLVDPAAPAQSVLILKATGAAHGGGALLPVGDSGYSLLLAWVTSGAAEHSLLPGAAKVATPAANAGASAPQSTNVEGATTPSPGPHEGVGLNLPYGLALDGRFDIAYERRGFSGNPFGGSAVNALRSYHHFLFLSRESTDDPFGLSMEMLSLQFWEAHYRWRAKDLPVQVVISGGKILVPFGADPLMHQSYGGLSGFDQRLLPVIWAQEGVTAHLLIHRREWSITDDLYVVRGYLLKQVDGIINLQNDFSPDDNARLGWGNRLGAGWGSLSAWVSTYYNPLGFGRRLFMQAADVMLWRLRQIPVLGHFSFAAGLLRADVSGGDDQGSGGSGKDYYHFGSYLQVRYHPTASDWLYLQYRAGVRTFNNRRGVVVDDTRLTSDDGSTHNFGVVARTHGLTAGVTYFVNLEKVAEIPNDLLRVSLSYDF